MFDEALQNHRLKINAFYPNVQKTAVNIHYGPLASDAERRSICDQDS